jgi:Trp operon repressor
VITNERQYRITKAELKRFEESLATHDARQVSPGVDTRVHQAMRDAIASEAEELRSQLNHYEQLRDGEIAGREIRSLRELPSALIEGRIAARLTQRELAARIGVAANDYTGVNLERLQSIADALGVDIHETITYSPAA